MRRYVSWLGVAACAGMAIGLLGAWTVERVIG